MRVHQLELMLLPYFRDNESLKPSSLKFDPTGEYIKKWVPELKDCSATDVHMPV